MSDFDFLGAEDKKAEVKKKLAVSAAIGGAVGGVVMALLWKSHRVLGGLLGLLVVGPVAGAGVGYAIVRKDLKELSPGDKSADKTGDKQNKLAAHGKK